MPVHPSDLVSELADPRFMETGAYHTFLQMSTLARDAPLVLVNTFRELEETVFDALDHLRSTNQKVSMHPFLPMSQWDAPSNILETQFELEVDNSTKICECAYCNKLQHVSLNKGEKNCLELNQKSLNSYLPSSNLRALDISKMNNDY